MCQNQDLIASYPKSFPFFCPCSSGISQLATFVHHPGPVVAPWGPGSDGSSHRRHQAQRLAAPKPLAGHPPGGRLKGQALPPASAKQRRAEFRYVGALEDGAFWSQMTFFPTCHVRVVRFYVSCLLLSSSPLLLLLLNHDPRRTVFSVGPQPRPSTPSVPCRTSTTTIPAQCSLPDLNHDHPRPVFPAGPQPRVSMPSVPCRTSCRKIWDKEDMPDRYAR